MAEALNFGMLRAAGEYIARIDADDLMTPDRLMKQIAYMDEHPNVIVCGGWQQYFDRSTYLHKPPSSAEQCRTNLLFRCDLCHSTVMLRKQVFCENNLFYDPNYAAEDFELWSRAIGYGEITNMPEVLGYYREHDCSITTAKKDQLVFQQGEIVAKTIERYFGIALSPTQMRYFSGWTNPFFDARQGITKKERKSAWSDLMSILSLIYQRNQVVQFCGEQELACTLRAEWVALRYNAPFELEEKSITDIRQIFAKKRRSQILLQKLRGFCKNYRGFRRKYWKIKSVLKG